MAETIFHTTFSTSQFLLSRVKNGSESGLRSGVSYRFGFNGKENDNEVKGTGNQQDYGMRIYDPRLGRFLSADPLIVQQQKYPELSPYQFASNTPIQAIDLDGLECSIEVDYESTSSTPIIGLTIDLQILNQSSHYTELSKTLEETIPGQMEFSFSGRFKYKGINFELVTDVNTTKYNAESSKYVLRITDGAIKHSVLGILGYTYNMDKGSTQENCFDVYLHDKQENIDEATQTGAHEGGHGFRLGHIKFGLTKQIRQNLMQATSDGETDQTKLNDRQRFRIVKNVLKDTGQWKSFKNRVKEYKSSLNTQGDE